MAKHRNLVGMTFGRLTVTAKAESNKHGAAMWRCACSCGREHVAMGSLLQRGEVKSCGCLKGSTPAPNRTHNMSDSPLYRVWATMRNRCNNPNVKGYKLYGGRGIKVCDRWESFENFLSDMGPRPSDLHSIDRINVDGDYGPSNCRWATQPEQASNKRNSRYLTANGETQTMAEWARRLGCNPAAILARLASGMSEAEAVTKPVPDRPNSRLTPAEALAIRATYPNLSAQKLADLYGVSKKTTLNVIHGKTFADLQ